MTIKEHTNNYTKKEWEFQTIEAKKEFVVRMYKIVPTTEDGFARKFGWNETREEIEEKFFKDFFEANKYYEELLENY
jgi:hypothetical protein